MNKYAIAHKKYGGFPCIVKAKTKKEALDAYQKSTVIKVNVKNLVITKLTI